MRTFIPMIVLFLSAAFATAGFSCTKLYPDDITTIHLIPYSTFPRPGESTGTLGIYHFSGENDNCTYACRCVYDKQNKRWRANLSQQAGCAFANQCEFCKSDADICKIRFIVDENVIYQQTFYANDSQKTLIEKCQLNAAQQEECHGLQKLPVYHY